MIRDLKEVTRDALTPERLTTIARTEHALYETKEAELAALLPSEFTQDLEFEVDYGEPDELVIADFRTFDGNLTSATKGGRQTARGEIQPLGRNYVLDEKTLLKAQRDTTDALNAKAENLVREATRAIAATMDVLRGQAIADGKIQLQMLNAGTEEIDFGRKTEFTTTAPKLWTDDTSDPLEYMASLVDLYREENHKKPELVWIPEQVARKLLRHPVVIKQARFNQNAFVVAMTDASMGRINESTLAATMAGMFDLPEVRITPVKKYRQNNLSNGKVEVKNLLPLDSIIFTSKEGKADTPGSSALGKTLWGQTMSSQMSGFTHYSGGFERESDLPGIVAGVIEHGNWKNLEVQADAIALPVVFRPNLTLKAKVV